MTTIKGYYLDEEKITEIAMKLTKETKEHLMVEVQMKSDYSTTCTYFEKKLNYQRIGENVIFLKKEDCYNFIKDIRKKQKKEIRKLETIITNWQLKKRRF